MKILVTGGAGFIGSHIVDAYINMGHEVHIVDNLVTGKRENLNPGAKFFKLDISSPEIAELLSSEKYEVINHHAAQMDVRKSVADPAYDLNVNILGSVRLLQAGVESGVKQFIFASSGGTVYGEQEYFPADESHPNQPISPYGVAKFSVEKYLYYYHIQYGLAYTAFRYANIYGPRQNPHGEAGVVAIFAERMLKGEPVVINGDGMQTRDYVHVEDVVAANVLALGRKDSGALNIGTGIESTVVDLFKIINESLGAGYAQNHGPAKPGEQRRSVLDGSLTRQALGWNPKWAIEEGLANTMSWFKGKQSN
jgi:UDP-glucose 4-epimerase